jgi:formylglycine-generating enzyme required for sulfatase activity
MAFQVSVSRGEEAKLQKSYTETVTTKLGDKITFKMVLIPGGTFTMGSPKEEPGHQENEEPQLKVKVDPFYFCTTEATLELFLAYYQEMVTAKKDFVESSADEQLKKKSQDGVDAITGPTPVYGELTMGYGKQNPAIGMTWHNAMTFSRWLSLKTGRKYRLPTEAEWEFASRAGTTEVYGYGSDPKELKDHAWFEDNADGETHPVAQKKPNAYGLYDMLGNVCEWVYDFYQPKAYQETAKKNPAENPQGPKSGEVHVARGGDYNSAPEELRCAYRIYEEAWWRSGDPQIPQSKWWLPNMDFIGVRIAKSIDPKDHIEGSK